MHIYASSLRSMERYLCFLSYFPVWVQHDVESTLDCVLSNEQTEERYRRQYLAK